MTALASRRSPWQRWRQWRQARTLARRPIPDALWHLTLTRYPFLAQRGAADLAALRELTTLFLADKEFAGVNGLQVDDQMAVDIAAQACLPALRFGLSVYDGFKGIVVQPDVVVARREVVDEDGVVHHYDEELSGEAMSGGPVMLSWQDVADAGESSAWGYNVVIHEFAHVLDTRPEIGPQGRADRARWHQQLEAEFVAFCARVDAGEDTLLDPYGAEAIEEFFAVACEAFFVAADDLWQEHPHVYALLIEYFQQDPRADSTPP